MTLFPPPLLTRRTVLGASLALVGRYSLAAGSPLPGGAAGEALHVLDRVGGGPGPGDLERVMRMGPQAWVDEQLHPERLALPAALVQQLAQLSAPRETQQALVQRYRSLEQAAKDAAPRRGMAASAAGTDLGQVPPTAERRERRALIQLVHLEAGDARLLRALQSPRQLEEVMVDFWFNHFNVYDGKGLVRVLVESYDRQAIRPHVFGKFRTLLGATAKHPAMLFYLDNWLSVSADYKPRRVAANRVLSGLNENYARELMELHTLGVDAGYSQKDVTELARILTGWTFGGGLRHPGDIRNDGDGSGDSMFAFDPERHDNGTKSWMGRTVAPAGQDEGEMALDVLARHPATARRLSAKLAQHFVADVPPPSLVDKLARRWQDTDGDIRALLKTLFDSAEFQDPRARGAKFKTPYRYVISAVRASGIPATNMRPLMATLAQLGQPLFGCQTPDGYKDTEDAWLNPSAITQRVNFATALAAGRFPLARVDDPGKRRALGANAMDKEAQTAQEETSTVPGSTPPLDPNAVLATLGPAISDKTRAAVATSEPALRAALVLGSPDFMRH